MTKISNYFQTNASPQPIEAWKKYSMWKIYSMSYFSMSWSSMSLNFYEMTFLCFETFNVYKT